METESDFREMLKQKGFMVNEKHESDNSVDIVAIKNGAYFLIDIKTASTDNRIRYDAISNDAEFGIAICNNGWFYPVGVKAGKHAKVYRFMSMM